MNKKLLFAILIINIGILALVAYFGIRMVTQKDSLPVTQVNPLGLPEMIFKDLSAPKTPIKVVEKPDTDVPRSGNHQEEITEPKQDGEFIGSFYVNADGAVFSTDRLSVSDKRKTRVFEGQVGEMVNGKLALYLYVDKTDAILLERDDEMIERWSSMQMGNQISLRFKTDLDLGFLDVHTELRGPYSIYKPVMSTVYACTGPFMQYEDKQTGALRDAVYTGCETNGTDYLTQYEFTAAGTGISTGGEYCESWSKMYSRRAVETDVYFVYRNEPLFHPMEDCLDPDLGGYNAYNNAIGRVEARAAAMQEEIEFIDELVKNLEIVTLENK